MALAISEYALALTAPSAILSTAAARASESKVRRISPFSNVVVKYSA
jgi:hypothetical protein